MNNIFNDVSTLIQNTVNQFIVKPLGVNGSKGINGYVFDILGDEEMSFDSDITDHFVELNYSIQDHIALRPLEFTLKGYVAELNDYFPQSLLDILTQIQSLGLIGDYTPEFTTQATQIYNKIIAVTSQVNQVINEAQNIYSVFINSSTTATKQQSAFNLFMTMWNSRQLCTVETPWAVFNNLAIKNIHVMQRDDSRFVTEFSVTFKQIRTASSYSVAIPQISTQASDAGTVSYAGRVNDMTVQQTIDGISSGQTKFTAGSTVSTDYYTSVFPVLGGAGGGF
jgi:hypothetical protein